MNCEYLPDAINEIYRFPSAASGNFLVANKQGVVVDFELTPSDVDFIEPKRGFIVHTNHFQSQRFRQLDYGLRNNGGDSIVRRQFNFLINRNVNIYILKKQMRIILT